MVVVVTTAVVVTGCSKTLQSRSCHDSLGPRNNCAPRGPVQVNLDVIVTIIGSFSALWEQQMYVPSSFPWFRAPFCQIVSSFDFDVIYQLEPSPSYSYVSIYRSSHRTRIGQSLLTHVQVSSSFFFRSFQTSSFFPYS